MFRLIKNPAPIDLSVYMDPIEFSQLVSAIEARAPKTFLEWGCGGSTKALLEHFPFIERFVSVEHDPRWHSEVSARITDPRLDLHLVEANIAPPDATAKREASIAWSSRAESDHHVMRDYVTFPRSLGMRFDFILVDGRARNFCMMEGYDLLASGGVLALHDAQRGAYHATLATLGRARFLTPWKQGQLCLLRKP
jgi:hypothetical protein